MKARSWIGPALSFALVSIGMLGYDPRSAALAAPRASLCGPSTGPRGFVEPPDVRAWELPLNAAGAHELVMSVHRDGDRFCYRYVLDGAEQTTAPTIRVRRGEHVAIRIVNDLKGRSPAEAASSASVPACMPMEMPAAPVQHFVGYLNHTIDDRYVRMKPGDTNLHLHGFQGPADQENIFVSSLSTPAHACDYAVTIPRTQPPGTYFYHPHAHGVSESQVARGLAGVWIVEPDEPQVPRSAEHVIVLRYGIPFRVDNPYAPDGTPISLAGAAHEAALRPAQPAAYDPFNPPPWPLTFPMQAGGVVMPSSSCDGVGNEPLLTVDGADAPAPLSVPAGEPQLLRIVNATSDSPKALELHDAHGASVPLQVVALDGTPVSGDQAHPFAHAVTLKRLLLPPAGRADIVVTAAAGQQLVLASEHFCEGVDAFYQMHHDLLRIRAADGVANGAHDVLAAPSPVTLTPAAQLVAFARRHPAGVRRRAITFTEYELPKSGKTPHHSAFYITDTTNPRFHEHAFWPVYQHGGMVPSNADIVVKQGAVEEWYLINTTMESHSFHIHQMSFVQEGTPLVPSLARDVAFVPVGTLLPNPREPNYPLVRPSITKVLLDFRHVPRGTFVYHCHMLFHEDHGMMGIIRVE